jgi:hypothetical protein
MKIFTTRFRGCGRKFETFEKTIVRGHLFASSESFVRDVSATFLMTEEGEYHKARMSKRYEEFIIRKD